MRSAKRLRAAILASALPTPPAPTRRMRMSWILTRFDTKSSVDTEMLVRKPLRDAIIGARTVARGGLYGEGCGHGHHGTCRPAGRAVGRQGSEVGRPRPDLHDDHRDRVGRAGLQH